MSEVDDQPEPTEPCPPRFRWLKRLSVIYLLLMIALALAYWAWWTHSNRLLVRELAALRSRGEPAELIDFLPTHPLPDERNGAIPLIAAAAQVKDWSAKLPYPLRENLWQQKPEDRPLLAEHVTPHMEALRLARSARSFHQADWGTRVRRDSITIRLPHLTEQRDLNRLLDAAAAYQHAIGDDRAALEHCLDMLHQGKLLAEDTPTVVTIMTARGFTANALNALSMLCSSAALEREDLRLIIRELLDEQRDCQRFVDAMRFMRAAHPDYFETYIRSKNIWPEAMYRIDTVRRIRQMNELVAAAKLSNYADARPGFAVPPWVEHSPPATHRFQQFSSVFPARMVRVTHTLSDIVQPLGHNLRTQTSVRLARRVVAVQFAARLHELDYGRLPSQWNELVPAYLPSVPPDPFASGDQSLRLARHPGGFTVVYSVGSNGIDDRAADNPRYRQRVAGWPRTAPDHRRLDLVFPISPLDDAKLNASSTP